MTSRQSPCQPGIPCPSRRIPGFAGFGYDAADVGDPNATVVYTPTTGNTLPMWIYPTPREGATSAILSGGVVVGFAANQSACAVECPCPVAIQGAPGPVGPVGAPGATGPAGPVQPMIANSGELPFASVSVPVGASTLTTVATLAITLTNTSTVPLSNIELTGTGTARVFNVLNTNPHVAAVQLVASSPSIPPAHVQGVGIGGHTSNPISTTTIGEAFVNFGGAYLGTLTTPVAPGASITVTFRLLATLQQGTAPVSVDDGNGTLYLSSRRVGARLF